jgi:hypothetical protein
MGYGIGNTISRQRILNMKLVYELQVLNQLVGPLQLSRVLNVDAFLRTGSCKSYVDIFNYFGSPYRKRIQNSSM